MMPPPDLWGCAVLGLCHGCSQLTQIRPFGEPIRWLCRPCKTGGDR